jgi:LSD1 subclass zinc finger protein
MGQGAGTEDFVRAYDAGALSEFPLPFDTESGERKLQWVKMEAVPRHFGGRMYLFVCQCGRRALRLYLPPGSEEFRCRACHNLTYKSVQQHDSRIDRLVKMPLESFVPQCELALSVGKVSQQLRYIKALFKREEKEGKQQTRRRGSRAAMDCVG